MSQTMMSGELARELGVSPQTIRNWRNDSMPSDIVDGQTVYDLDLCKTWASENKRHGRGGKRHGGNRRGAGRKTKRPEPDAGFAKLVEAGELRREIAERSTTPDGAIRVDALLQVTSAELRALATFADEVGLTNAHADLLNSLLKARSETLKLQTAEGDLIDAGEAREAWARRLQTFKHELGRVAAHAASAVMASLEIPPEQGPELRTLIQTEINTALTALAG